MAWNRKCKRLALMLAALILCSGLAGCQGGGFLPDMGAETTGPVSGGQTLPAGEGSAEKETEPIQPLPPDAQLSAVQCYYEGVLQREYTLTYEETGVLASMVIYTYDDGQLYSWGQNVYTYDDRGNLISNVYTHTLGSQRWDYENTYDAEGRLAGYQVTEHYNEKLASEYFVTCAYDAGGRYMGPQADAQATFDAAGRILTLRTLISRGDYRADIYTEYDHSCVPVVIYHTHTVYPEYEQFSSGLRLMLNLYHEVFSLDMKDGYQLITDEEGVLTRIVDADGEDVCLFIYD